MTDQITGGMFSRLLDPKTAKPKVDIEPHVTESQPVVSAIEKQVKQIENLTNSTPLPIIDKRKKKKDAKDGKHQISAWIPISSFEEFIKVHRTINPPIETIEKSYILGLAVETFCKVIGTDLKIFKSPEQFKAYVESKLKDKF